MRGVRDLGQDAVELFHGGRAPDNSAHADIGAQLIAQVAALHVEDSPLAGAFEYR
jgi:hypothetical protein